MPKRRSMIETRAEQIALLRAGIRRSGMSNRQFAERVMVRDERTVRRWLSGKQAIPETVLRRLRDLTSPPTLR